jgi:hypothetical protein
MKYVIIVTWSDDRQEAYPTLTSLLAKHEIAPINTINNYISRKGVPYTCDKCIIQKIKIIRD